jgi:hypothetical protein
MHDQLLASLAQDPAWQLARALSGSSDGVSTRDWTQNYPSTTQALHAAFPEIASTVSLGRPLQGGAEHDVWYDEGAGVVRKSTLPGEFGNLRPDGSNETLAGYLERIALQNSVFGDEWKVIGKMGNGKNLRIITQQPVRESAFDATGNPLKVSDGEVKEFMGRHGFSQVSSSSTKHWVRPDGVEVWDAHPGNFVKTPQGNIIPVDLNIRLNR